MPLMEALNKSCLYNGRNYKPGERFEMNDPKHAEMFVGWGKAKVVSETTTAPTYETAAMKPASDDSEDTFNDREQRKKREYRRRGDYKRRDMRPEE